MLSILKTVACDLNATSDECLKFETVFSFLINNPASLAWRSRKAPRPDLASYNGVKGVFQKYLEAIKKPIAPSLPKTIPDPVVYLIMQEHYGHSTLYIDQAKEIHSQSMSSENVVGGLLEKYLSEKLQFFGWVWCAGSLIKATDFIKKDERGWHLLQVKNRSNSENSSSMSVRDETNIRKWYRINAQTGETKWAEFPDEKAASHLSEKEFSEFVKNHIKKLKSQ